MTIKQLFSILLVCSLGISVRAQETAQLTAALENASTQSSKPKFSLAIDSLLLGRNVADSFYQNTSLLADVMPQLKVNYNSWLSFDLVTEFVFVAGNAKSFFTEEGKSQDGIHIDEATVNLAPISNLEIRGGILATKINPVKSILTEPAFMGAFERYDFKGDVLTLSLMAQQAVPTAGGPSKGFISDDTGAFFMSQTAQLEANLAKHKVTAALTRFEFGNLSSNVAAESNLIGNDLRSFEGIGKNTRFLIGFSGLEGAGCWEAEWSKYLKTKLIGYGIVNSEAPADRNSGFYAKLGVTGKFNNIHITPSYSRFNMGADVTPATYSVSPFRWHNRDGGVLEIKVELEKEKVSFFVSRSEMNVILPNPYLADREIYNLGVEAKYDIL